MGRKDVDKRAVVLVARVLIEYSDSQHYMKTADIAERIAEEFGIEYRNSIINSAAEALRDGSEIDSKSSDYLDSKYLFRGPYRLTDKKRRTFAPLENPKGRVTRFYYAEKMDGALSLDDVMLLFELARASSSLGKSLEYSLDSLLNYYERDARRKSELRPSSPLSDGNVYIARVATHLRTIQDAIKHNQWIKVEHDGGSVECYFPLHAGFVEGYFYLLGIPERAISSRKSEAARLDKMRSVQMVEESSNNSVPDDVNELRIEAMRRMESSVNRMMNSVPVEVDVVCRSKIDDRKKRRKNVKNAAGVIKDNFSGREVYEEKFQGQDGEKRKFAIYGDKEGMTAWLMKWIQAIEIEKPFDMRSRIIFSLKHNLYGDFERSRSDYDKKEEERQKIKIKCKMPSPKDPGWTILDELKEQFHGNKNELTPEPDECKKHSVGGFVEFHFMEQSENVKYWALKWCDCVEVLEPVELRNAIVDLLKNNAYSKN